MRWRAIVVGIVATAVTPSARAESLAEVSVRAGAGLAAGGGAGRATVRRSPVVAVVDGAYAFRDQPMTWGFAGLVLETGDRTGVGLEGGLAIAVGQRGRARIGARSLVRPYTLHGATLGASWCWPSVPLRGCVDVEGDLYVAGTDLPARTSVAQVIVAVGVAFDAM